VAAFASTEKQSEQATPKLQSYHLGVIAAKDAESMLPSSSESELDSCSNSVRRWLRWRAGCDSDGNSVKSGSRRRRQRRAGKAHTTEELLSEAADDTPEDSGSESDDNDRPPRSAAEVQRAFAV